MNAKKQNKSKSYLAWTLAFIGGAAAAVFLMPWTGRRARNWVSQKSSHLMAESERLVGRAQTKVRYGAGKMAGLSHKARALINPTERADLDDDILSQRVQTALGENPLTWDLPRLNVNSEDLAVTVRGPVNNVQQLHDVENVVKNVKGVKRVVNDLRVAG